MFPTTLPFQIKICGIRSRHDLDRAQDLRVEAVGLNLYPPSPRAIPFAEAAALAAACTEGITPVAVMVKPKGDEIKALLQQSSIRWVQIHDADLAELQPLAAAFQTNLHLVLAHGVADSADVGSLHQRIDQAKTMGLALRAVLLDARVPGLHGGSGKTAAWDLIRQVKLEVPIVLAGGLTPTNVAEAIRVVRPAAVDVASGVESAPGIKDWACATAFVAAARNAFPANPG